ncbi:MAG: hypothetical protein IT239_04075 [Bacteroidia bacterium]|nr:hypothetical protein [Bacteroidia bacterium]
MNKMFDYSFFYRLRYFILGVLLGTIALWVIYWKDNRQKVYKWPSEIVINNLQTAKWINDPATACFLKQLTANDSLVTQALGNAKINFLNSSVNEKSCKVYQAEMELNNQAVIINFAYYPDSTVKIVSATVNNQSVSCK